LVAAFATPNELQWENAALDTPAPGSFLTERLLLRPLDPSDAPMLFAACCSDPMVTRYLEWMPHASVDDTRRFIAECLAPREDWFSFHWVIFAHATGQVVGMVAADIRGTDAGIGYLLKRDCWGQGYAAEAAGAVVELVEAETDVTRFFARADSANMASRRVLEKIGFRYLQLDERGIICPAIGPEPRALCWYMRRALA